MRRKVSILYGVIVVLIGLLLFSLVSRPKPDVKINTTIDTVLIQHDTIIYKKKLTPYKVDSFIVDSIIIPEDSLLRNAYIKLVFAYNLTRYYNDTIYSDSLNKVVLVESCSMNEILNRKVNVNIKNRVITKTTTIERNNYYNGLGIGAIVTPNSITPSIAYSTKNFIYLGGYDLQEKNIKLGLFYKFNFRK